MSSTDPLDERWTAVAHGALDIHGHPGFAPEAEILVVPIVPSPAMCLVGRGASLWRELVDHGPVRLSDLDDDDWAVLEHLEQNGLVFRGHTHPAAVTRLDPPVLSSPLHELVYAFTQRIADAAGIRCLFVKGPALHQQGLREREHSGDVDVWCDPDRWDDFASALEPWGWSRQPNPWRGTPIHHTATMRPTSWGCEIDVHRRLPGFTLDDHEAFAAALPFTRAMRYAGVEVTVPEVALHAVLAALHVVRPEIGASPRSNDVAATARMLLSRDPETLARAIDVGAVAVLRDELSAATGTEVNVDQGAEPHDWEWRGRPNRLLAYWTALQTLPLPIRFLTAWRLLWPDDDVALESERQSGGPLTTAAAARRSRLVRAVRVWAGKLPTRVKEVRPRGEPTGGLSSADPSRAPRQRKTADALRDSGPMTNAAHPDRPPEEVTLRKTSTQLVRIENRR